jgi:CcmD family protein
MRNFHFLFAAWMAVWLIFFGYEISVARRVSQLREEIERLKSQLRGQ